MIHVDRPPPPGILMRLADRWRDRLLAAQQRLLVATPKERAAAKRAFDNAEVKYRHAEVKEALVEMFHGKCAYCESKITHVDYGHIEHYRPKSRFPARTFRWSNLLLACGICNGSEYKSDQFPGPGEGGPFLNPCQEEPGDHLRFHFDPAVQLASVYGTTPRGETSERLLGLNRPALRAFRSKHVRILHFLVSRADGDPEAMQLLEEAVREDAEFAAFARALTA